MGTPDTKHIHYPAALGLGELPSKSDRARHPGSPNLGNEDGGSPAGSVSGLSSPGGGGHSLGSGEGSRSRGPAAAELSFKATAPWVPFW